MGTFLRRRGPARALTGLLLLDLVFLTLTVVHLNTRFLGDPRFSVMEDWGYGEILQYGKELAIVLLLVLAAWRRSSRPALAWSALFVYLLLDDSLQLHERVGGRIAAHLPLAPWHGLRPQDLGELAVSFGVGAALLGLVALTHRDSAPEAQQASRRLFVAVALLAFFGVVLDPLHVMLDQGTLSDLLGLLEDGGEMVVMSGIVGLCLEPLVPAPSRSSRDRR